MGWVVDVLTTVSAVLLPGVVLALLMLATRTVLEAGGALGEWGERRRAQALLPAVSDPGAGRGEGAPPRLVAAFQARCARAGDPSASIGRLVAEAELEARRALARAELGLRLGPVLGLMGTLIPLGPALLGLSRGDLQTAVQQLVIAFSTTVIGLLISGLAVVTLLARRGWYARDLADIEALAAALEEPNAPHERAA